MEWDRSGKSRVRDDRCDQKTSTSRWEFLMGKTIILLTQNSSSLFSIAFWRRDKICSRWRKISIDHHLKIFILITKFPWAVFFSSLQHKCSFDDELAIRWTKRNKRDRGRNKTWKLTKETLQLEGINMSNVVDNHKKI